MTLIPRFFYTIQFFQYFIKNKPDSFLNKMIGNRQRIIWVNSARSGLRLLLSSISGNSLNIGVQAYTCHTVFQAIKKAGHIPVFIDLNNEIKIDIDKLKERIDGLDVLIVTHTFGFPEDIDSIKSVTKDIIIIEDCAHSFLSKYKGEYTGTLGDAALFSTGLAKFPPVGTGGFLIINKDAKFPFLENGYAKLSTPNIFLSIKEFIKILIFSIMMKPPIYGLFTYKFGKILDSKLDLGNKFSFKEYKGFSWVKKICNSNFHFFEEMFQYQIKNANELNSLLDSRIVTIRNDLKAEPNFYIFPILSKNRDRIYEKLLKNNIETGKHFYKSLEWAKEFGYKEGECSNTEELVKQILTVPIHYGVSKKSIEIISNIINEE